MDSHRFDTLIKQLYVFRNRREGLRLLLTGIFGSALCPAAPAAAHHCHGRGARCKFNSACCSGGCVCEKVGPIKRKGPKKKRRRRCERRCACSGLNDRCNDIEDCCTREGVICGIGRRDNHAVCCSVGDGPCLDDSDCCEGFACDDELGQCVNPTCLAPGQACGAGDRGRVSAGGPESECCEPFVCLDGQCTDCLENGESCSVNVECCNFPLASCDINACGGGPLCCAITGEACTADCDCCASLECMSDGACGLPQCKEVKEECVVPEDCCDGGQIGKPFTCQDNPGCFGLPDRFCCALPGFGTACTDHCDCCGAVLCLQGSCGGP